MLSTSKKPTAVGGYHDLPYLTAVARIKIVNESRKSDHDLRHWVGHANFLDRLTRPSTIAESLQQQQEQQQQHQSLFHFSSALGLAHTKAAAEPLVEVVEISDDDT